MSILSDYNTLYLANLSEQERRRLEMYKLAWQYYHGHQRLSLKVELGKPNDNLTFNLYAYIIDKGVSFLFGKEVDFQIEEGQDTAEEQYLAEMWAANKRMTFLQNVALNGANCGHCFVEISPREGQTPRLINLDPAIIRPQWDSDDLEKVLWYKIEYPTTDPQTNKVMYRKRMIELQENGWWTITKYVKSERDPKYIQDGAVINWDYDFPPIVDWQNLPAPNEYFGRPDVELLDGQDAINFNFSNSQKIYRYHGHPKTVGKGFNADSVKVSPTDMILIPENGDVFNVEIQGDLNSAREDRKLLITTFLQSNMVPNLGDVDAALGAVSGVALKVRYGDLLSRTETKRRLYGDAIEEIDRRVRVLANMTDLKPTKQVWQSPLPENNAELVDQLMKERDMGATSLETARQELGRDPDTEAARIEAERLQADSIGGQLLRAFNRGAVE